MTVIAILRRSILPSVKNTTICLRCIHLQRNITNMNRLPKWMESLGSVVTGTKEFRFYRGILGAKYISNQSTTHEEHATTSPPPEVKESFGRRVLKAIGYLETVVRYRTAERIYESCADGVNYQQFFQECNMEDTFQSWFLVLHLHIWMCLVRLKAEGRDGRKIYHIMVKMMWEDLVERIKQLGVDSARKRSKNMKELNAQFQGLMLAYDEGLISDDKVLSSALWRNMFVDTKDNADILKVAALTDYVRRTMLYMDGLNSEKLLNEGSIQWLPFYEHQESETETTVKR